MYALFLLFCRFFSGRICQKGKSCHKKTIIKVFYIISHSGNKCNCQYRFRMYRRGLHPPASKLLDGIHRAAFRGLRGAAFRGFRHFVRHGGSHALIGHGEYLRTKADTQAAADAVFIYRIFHWKSPLCSYYTPSGSGICRKMRGFLHCMGKASPSAGRLKLSKNASLRASSFLAWQSVLLDVSGSDTLHSGVRIPTAAARPGNDIGPFRTMKNRRSGKDLLFCQFRESRSRSSSVIPAKKSLIIRSSFSHMGRVRQQVVREQAAAP